MINELSLCLLWCRHRDENTLVLFFFFCRCTAGNSVVRILRSGVSSFPGCFMQDAAVSPLQWTKLICVQTSSSSSTEIIILHHGRLRYRKARRRLSWRGHVHAGAQSEVWAHPHHRLLGLPVIRPHLLLLRCVFTSNQLLCEAEHFDFNIVSMLFSYTQHVSLAHLSP